MKTGFFIVGTLMGYKCENFSSKDTGEVKERHSLGIQLQTPNGFGGYDTETQSVKVDPKYANDALKRTIEQLKSKMVQVQVTPREWVMEDGRKGITYNFDGNSTIEAVQ